MSRLAKAISNVDAESLPAIDSPPADTASDPGPAPGDKSGKDEGGRTIDNVRGELARKMEQQRDYFTGQITALSGKIDQLLNASPPASKEKSANTLDDLSIAELKTLRGQVPDEQRSAFDEYFEERRVREQVETQVKAITNKQSFADRERAATEQAMTRWPDLRDATSELYRATNKILLELGAVAESNPRAVLDAANEAGMQLGLPPRADNARRMRSVKSGVPGHSSSPTDDDADLPSQKEIESIAASLGGGMKTGKFTKEQLDRIAQNTAAYRKHKQTLLK